MPGALIESMDDLSDATKAQLLAGSAAEYLGADLQQLIKRSAMEVS